MPPRLLICGAIGVLVTPLGAAGCVAAAADADADWGRVVWPDAGQGGNCVVEQAASRQALARADHRAAAGREGGRMGWRLFSGMPDMRMGCRIMEWKGLPARGTINTLLMVGSKACTGLSAKIACRCLGRQ